MDGSRDTINKPSENLLGLYKSEMGYKSMFKIPLFDCEQQILFYTTLYFLP